MCIRCICNDLKPRIEEEYPFNRNTILYDLYTYFGVNDGREMYPDIHSDELRKRAIDSYDKLKEICTLLEEGADKDEVMSQLEILEVTSDFLQRQHEGEEHRVYQHKRLY